MKHISVEQLFYGRGAHGYGILGVSPGAAGMASRVEELCGAVGTPSGDYGGEPFLMSVPDGRRVIMFCGRRGASDSMGRATLFFHVLVAEKDALAAAKADAFSLFEQRAFADKMPAGDVATLRLDVGGAMSGTDGYPQFDRDKLDVTLPCIFRSEKPTAKLVRNAIGNRANEFSWTTFAFQPMKKGFDVQVLSPRTTAPRTMNEYDVSGKLFRSASTANKSRVEEKPQSDVQITSQPDYDRREKASTEGDSAMLKFSIFTNIVLVIVIVVLVTTRMLALNTSNRQIEPTIVTNVVERVVERKVEVPLSDSEISKIERAAINRFICKLRNEFPSKARIQDTEIDANMDKLPKIDDIKNDPKFADQKSFLDKLRANVDFVNKTILEVKTP